MRNDKNIIETIYILSVIAAFGLLFYANAEQQEIPDGTVVHLGIGKLFYLPCGIALVCSILMKTAKDRLNKVLNWMIALTIVSTLLHPQPSSSILTMTATRYIMAIFCFRDLRHIDPKKFVYYATLASPIIVFPHYILANPFNYGAYRYGGFYGDANFLALALNLLITLCYLSFRLDGKKWLGILATLSIAGSVPLILLGMSRGGLIGLSVILFFIGRDILKKSKAGFAISMVLLAFAINYLAPKMSNTLYNIEDRFGTDAMSGMGAQARWVGIQNCLTVFAKKPELIPFGIGPGNTVVTIPDYKYYGYQGQWVIHNTFFSILYEMGLIVALLYTFLYTYNLKKLYRKKTYLLIGLLISMFISLFTLPGASFMPGWITIFFISNNRLTDFFDNDNTGIDSSITKQ